MRLLLALSLLALPLAAQEAASQAKPEEKTAAQPAAQTEKTEEQKAESPAPAAEAWLTGSIDFGYRWLTDVRGNFNSYRSVVNLGEGPKLFGLDFTLQDPKRRLFDRLDARAYGWGGDPYSTARVDARKLGLYDFTFDYRNIAYFDNLPSFADPLINASRGFFFDERAFDTRRRMTNVELSLFPGKRIVPFLAYERDSGHGRGVTTFMQNADEFAVPDLMRDSTDSYRGGVRLEFNRWHITLEEGGIAFKNDQQVLSPASRNIGNVSTPFTDLSGNAQQLFLNSVNQAYAIRSQGAYTKALLTASPLSWVNVFGQFVFSQPHTDVAYSDQASGNFVNLAALLFYTGQVDIANGTVKQPHTTANAGFELRPFHGRLRVIESWNTDRLHNAAAGLLTQQLFFTPSQPNVGPTTAGLDDRLAMNYSRNQTDVLFDITRHITVRGGYRYEWGDAAYTAPPLSQTGPVESGELRRNIGLAGVSFRTGQKLWVNADYEGASSDRTYFRTSLHDSQMARLRARYQMSPALSLSANFRILSNENPTPGINYDFLSRDNSLSVYWTPNGGKRVSVLGEYTRSSLRSDINYFVPQNLTPARSLYRDNGHTATAAFDFVLPAVAGAAPRLTVGGSLFESSGSRPSRYYQPLARLSVPFQKHVYWNTEWRWYGFGEQFYLYEGFRAHVFQTGLRLTR